MIEKDEVILLTGAHGDVAELGLFGETFAWLSSVLGRLAVAGAIAVAPAAGGRAQAPWRPLIPGSIHCTGATEKRGHFGQGKTHFISIKTFELHFESMSFLKSIY